MELLEVTDLAPFASIDEAKAEQMVDDAIAQAILAAPCLEDIDSLTGMQIRQAKSVLRGAVLRWNDAGSGAFAAQTAGPFGVTLDTRQARRSMFWPSEITDLQKICKGVGSDGGAFSIDTAPAPMTMGPWFGTSWDAIPQPAPANQNLDGGTP